ncbi:tRNA pseudouridine(55) synthase TruB [Gudongella sp. SC589]|jgi:tRNA pseudouridine55 synthase|uniref:tRNA pseudouridine(55) synthase TruB n=1 Tax=Gudongella sp. SC589 TaxID=3385990 RepID=UPI003904A540
MNGIINFFKPAGMTSHDAVAYFRRLLGTKKVGHTGTLDPMATGVLPICVGKGTKVSEYLLGVDKEYIAELTLGTSSDTQDRTGTVINSSDEIVSETQIKQVFESFRGEIYQVPPMYSAKKIGGRKLYDLARNGIEVEREPRKINIKDIRILHNQDNRKITFYTRCSKGTYIRTICNDIGELLGTYGHMSYLLRVGVGDFKIEDSYGMDTLNEMDKDALVNIIQPMDNAILFMDSVNLDDRYYKPLTNGVRVELNKKLEVDTNKLHRIYVSNEFIGIGNIIEENDRKTLKMEKVLIR